jgi:hypothetical protein
MMNTNSSSVDLPNRAMRAIWYVLVQCAEVTLDTLHFCNTT